MQTLSRIYPVPAGVGTLGGGSGGIRYAIDPTLVNVGPNSFCGTGLNFDSIKAQLAQFLVSWNTANPTAQADRVVGAISSDLNSNGVAISNGASTGCADGMASVISPEAWVRAIPDTASTPSMTGALLAMEIAHTFGIVPPNRSGTYHSLVSAADGTAPNRGYNVSLRAFLSDDHTAMRLSGTWNNNDTILEPADWTYLLCVLGGQTNTECTTSAIAGSSTGVAAIASAFALTGHTDGTAAGTKAQESYVASDLEGRGTDTNSNYKLVQRGAGNAILQSNGVRVAFNASIHNDNPGANQEPVGTFAAVVGLNLSATKFELWKGTPGSGTLLWSTQKTNPPSVTSFTTAAAGATDYTNSPGSSEAQPAFADDGSWLAWTRNGDDIQIAPRSDATKAVTVPKPPLVGTNGRIVFARDGDIYAMPPDSQFAPTLIANNGSQPVWSPDGTEIAFTRGGDIWVMNAGGSNQRQLTNTAALDRSPTYSPDGRIAFVREDATDGEIWVMNGDGSGQTQLTDNAALDEHPAWSPDGQLIAFDSTRSAGGQWRIYTMAPDGSNQTQVPNSVDGDLAPAWSPTGDRLAFYNACGCNGIELDLFVIGADGSNRTQVTSTTGVGEFNPTWSGDGTALTFFSGPLSASLTLSGPADIEIINVDGTGRQNLTSNPADDLYPNWQMIRPAATFPALVGTGGNAKLAFVTEGDIYTLPVDLSGAAPRFSLSGLRRVYDAVRDGPPASHPTWKPDGTQLAFAGSEGSIWLLDLATGQSTQLTDTGSDSWPSWSRTPNLNLIAFERAPEQVWQLDPADPGRAALVTTGQTPSFGTDGRIAFARNGQIMVVQPGQAATQVFDDGFQPALVDDTFAFGRSFVVPGTEFFYTDIMIGSPGRGVNVRVEATDDNAADDRLDLLVDCHGLVYVAAVALKPDQLAGTSSSWATNYDPSLTCSDPTLRVAVSDGYNRVTGGTSQDIQAAQKPPTAAIYTPSVDSTFRQYDVIPASGAGWDPEDGTLAAGRLQWQLSGPSGFSRSGSGPSVDFSPQAGGFPVGNYTLTLTVTDSAGGTDTATRAFAVVADADNDGLTAAEDGAPCVGDPNEQNPLTAYLDGDGDGIPNIDDPAICTAATSYEALVDIDSQVSHSSALGVVTAYVRIPYRSVADVNGSSVRISSIDGVTLANPIPALRWSVDSGVGIAKFDRTALLSYFDSHNMGTRQTAITVAGNGSTAGQAWTFAGTDTTLIR